MKQGKKLLCVLLAMILSISCLTVGVSAYKTDYSTPGKGYNSVLKPVFTPEQGASAILDFVDDKLAPLGDKIDIDKLGIHVHIYSLDSAFDSLKDIFESTVYKLGKIFDLGDIEDLSVSIPKNGGIRRRSASMSDFTFFNYFLQFVKDNADPLYKFADNSIDLGLIGNFWNPKKELTMLNDLHGYINEMIYGIIIDKNAKFDEDATLKAKVDAMKLDDIIQDFLNNRIIKFVADMFAEVKNGVPSNPVAEFLGLEINEKGELKNQIGLVSKEVFPSLTASKVSITQTTTYELINNLIQAIINDVVVKFAGDLILDALKIKPEDTSADTSYINIAINLFITAADLGLPEDAGDDQVIPAFLATQGCPNPEAPKPIDKINAALKYILGVGNRILPEGQYEGIKKFIRFMPDGKGGSVLQLDETLQGDLSNYVKMLLPMLNGFAADTFAPMTPAQEAALEEMNDEATFAFMVQYLLENLVDNVKFDFQEDCSTIRQLATWTLVNVAAELLPNLDFESKIKSGEIDPNSNDCLNIASAIVAYYLNGEFGMNINYEGISFEKLLGQAFDFFLEKYAVLFTTTPYTNKFNGQSDPQQNYKIWHDLNETVNQWIPLTNIVHGINNSNPEVGLRDLFMGKIVNSVLDFDINGLLSIFGRRGEANSEFQKPLTRILMNLVARIINGVFHLPTETGTPNTNDAQKALIIPYAYTTLDQLTTNVNSTGVLNGTGLKNTLKMLLTNITNITGTNSLVEKSADMVAEIVGVIKTKDFEYMKVYYDKNHQPGETFSIKSLRTLYDKLSLAGNEGKKYYQEGYEFFHMVDFAPWSYLSFRKALRSAESILDQYDKFQVGAAEAPTRADITYSYYVLNQYQTLLAENQREASDYQLIKTINKYNSDFATLIAPIESGVKADENKGLDGQPLYTDRTYNAFKNAWLFAKKVLTEFAPYKAQGTTADYRQSKINEARFQLIDAVQRLKDYIPLADYSNLDIAQGRVVGMDRSPSYFTSATVSKVIEAYKKAISTERDYDMDEQSIVDAAYDALTEAIDSLQTVTYIEVFDPSMNYLDIDNKMFFGLGENFFGEMEAADWGYDFPMYFSAMYGMPMLGEDYADADNYFIDMKPTALGNGTGSKIQVIIGDPYDESIPRKVANSYDSVVFGDVNGDGMIDGMDAVIMRMHAGFMIDKELTAKCVITAGDLNYDGTIGTSDAKVVANYGIGLKSAVIDQCPEALMNEHLTFADLIG